MPGYNSQRRGTARTLPNYFDHSGFESQKAFQQKLIVSFCVLFVCKRVLPPGDNPIAVNRYIICHILHDIFWYIISIKKCKRYLV